MNDAMSTTAEGIAWARGQLAELEALGSDHWNHAQAERYADLGRFLGQLEARQEREHAARPVTP